MHKQNNFSLVLGVTLLSISTSPEVKVKFRSDTSLFLSCNYSFDHGERISDREIKWQKQINNSFVDVAVFSPPGGQEPYIHKMATALANRTTLITSNTSVSSSATMIIHDVVCSDEGLYRCWIEYFVVVDSTDEQKKSSSAVTFEAEAKKPVDFVLEHQDQLEENQSIHLICAADVGSPAGNIKIWKVPEKTNIPEIVFTSQLLNNKTKNCTTFLNVNPEYKVSRKDNGIKFLCSSQNSLTQDPGPERYSQRISVLYGPGTSTLTLVPFKDIYYIGDDLKLECFSDSNPPPIYSWTFQSTNNSEDTKYNISYRSSLILNNLQINNSGNYTCSAFNTFNGKNFNVTSVVSISVRNPDIQAPLTCDSNPCQIGELCKEKDGQAVCGFNMWKAVSFIFIPLTVVFASSVAFLFIKIRANQQLLFGVNKKNTRLPSSPTKGKENDKDTSQQDGNELYDVAWT
ncbi:carcinoembryonic antigen-related cell adhesion molecule 6-like [Saccostrea cucullata]|uniref:carcinoembryonic antigen-related cell adhesion molecule 6-like n=1 Tax=Saccostrea cuccullata TaxID=36930 RepID=UPI002ED6222B